MTTTIMGRCARTGQLGIALATGTLAAGGLHFYKIATGVGIVAHQSAGDFDMARLGFRLLEMGFSPGKILSELETSDPYPEYRQIGVLDRSRPRRRVLRPRSRIPGRATSWARTSWPWATPS